MTLEKFLSSVSFFDMNEGEKAKHLAFYHRQVSGIKDFAQADLSAWFQSVGLSPNASRLVAKIKKDKWATNASKTGYLQIHGKHLLQLEKAYPLLKEKSENVEFSGALLPKELYAEVNRKYVRHIADQANWAYEANAFDACAVMMRRLLELLLIHTFKNKTLEASIKKPDGHYIELDLIINQAVTNPAVGLTQGVVKELKALKDLGNLGAHDIVYLVQKSDIESRITVFRKVIAHLIDYAGFKS
ncbi:MAG: hypothetical protein JWO78_1767 [Micavibrio sp.]|nr:hypothetical protein [Micavibrio sp.]